MGWGGVGGHVNVPCTSYIIVCYAAEISAIVATLLVTTLAEISGVVAAMTVKRQKTRLRFCKVSNIRNQRGTVVKSPFLDKICTPMSTVSSPAG